MAQDQEAETACPVDHKTREAWLAKSKAAAAPHPLPSLPSQTTVSQSCDSSQMDQSLSTPPGTALRLPASLAQYREISSIPRAPPEASVPAPRPVNNEQETGSSASGHWIYPSERMFFEALRRKNFEAREEDMGTIVPIHNAVNEKAWQEILAWERGKGSERYVLQTTRLIRGMAE